MHNFIREECNCYVYAVRLFEETWNKKYVKGEMHAKYITWVVMVLHTCTIQWRFKLCIYYYVYYACVVESTLFSQWMKYFFSCERACLCARVCMCFSMRPRGVDNGAAGAAAAAPIIWLVVVIQKWRTFRRTKQIFLCLYECNFSVTNH